MIKHTNEGPNYFYSKGSTFVIITFLLVRWDAQKDHVYAGKGLRVTHVNTLSIITLQNIVPDVRNESRKQSRTFLCTCDVCIILL